MIFLALAVRFPETLLIALRGRIQIGQSRLSLCTARLGCLRWCFGLGHGDQRFNLVDGRRGIPDFDSSSTDL